MLPLSGTRSLNEYLLLLVRDTPNVLRNFANVMTAEGIFATIGGCPFSRSTSVICGDDVVRQLKWNSLSNQIVLRLLEGTPQRKRVVVSTIWTGSCTSSRTRRNSQIGTVYRRLHLFTCEGILFEHVQIRSKNVSPKLTAACRKRPALRSLGGDFWKCYLIPSGWCGIRSLQSG